MAVLADTDRAAVSGDYQRDCSRDGEVFGALTKADVRAAVDGLDTYLNTSASAINQAIPATARAALTTAQKARLLKYVITKRYLAGA